MGYAALGNDTRPWHIKEAALHYTCRQIHSETRNKHFALNTFAGAFSSLCSYKKLARHPGLQHIRHVLLDIHSGNIRSRVRYLRLLPARPLLDDLRLLRKLKGLESITARVRYLEDYDENELRSLMSDYFEFDREAAQPVSIVFKDMEGERET
jgi:hypothetical protein